MGKKMYFAMASQKKFNENKPECLPFLSFQANYASKKIIIMLISGINERKFTNLATFD